MTNIRKEAFIKEYRSVYLEDPNFENINDLDLYSWWQWACDWQKQYDASLIYIGGDKRYQPYVERVEEEVRKICAGEILNG